MNQYLAIYQVREMLSHVLEVEENPDLKKQLRTIDQALEYFLDKGIDFKQIVDGLDDSIMITDKDGSVLYVNPAYTKNTGITPSRVLNRKVSDLIEKDKLFSGGALCDVLATQASAFRLSTTYGTGAPMKGYVSGTPIFDENGQLHQAVACSRPIISLRALQEDFNVFVRQLQELNPKSSRTDSETALSDDMVGKDGTLANLWTLIGHIAPSDATVLITGESGSGKEVIADEIYRNSKRNKQPFVKINCAAIPAHLLESELFGYEKGAFSGASAKGKVGLFELANHGTLMLDEIGDMPMDLQVKLLRAIQQQEITRIGGSKPIKLDIRFLALTNSNLKEKIANGTFRQDLYYRLNVIPIYVPPLRERTADLKALCDRFIEKFSEKYNRPFSLTDHQMDLLRAYSWPGNIRELENIIEYFVLCSSGIGQVDDTVIAGLLNLADAPSLPSQAAAANTDFATAVADFEKSLLENALRESGNLREAGNKLNINASTISRKIKQYHIDYDALKKNNRG